MLGQNLWNISNADGGYQSEEESENSSENNQEPVGGGKGGKNGRKTESQNGENEGLFPGEGVRKRAGAQRPYEVSPEDEGRQQRSLRFCNPELFLQQRTQERLHVHFCSVTHPDERTCQTSQKLSSSKSDLLIQYKVKSLIFYQIYLFHVVCFLIIEAHLGFRLNLKILLKTFHKLIKVK